MHSPIKIAIFSFLFFATLALATCTSEGQLRDPEALISSTNIVLEKALLPLTHITSDNATEYYIRPVINDVVDVVVELTSSLRESSLSSCANGCTAFNIVELIAITIKIICEPLGIAYGLYPSLVALLGPTRLVAVMVKLLDAVLVLVGGIFGQLIVLLIRNGCVGIMADLQLVGLLAALGLDGLGRLGSFLGNSKLVMGSDSAA